ncbi:IFI27 [Acrasis kona]|uniref:IFI27 n=1 Tax=Acrasis kona TaxID=1008807 RepID=A0AAW2Z5M3_9EUKA
MTDPLVGNREVGWRNVAESIKANSYLVKDVWNSLKSDLQECKNISSKIANDAWIHVPSRGAILDDARYAFKTYLSKLRKEKLSKQMLHWVGGAACAVIIYRIILNVLGFTHKGIAKKSVGSCMMRKQGASTKRGSLVSNLQSKGAKSDSYTTTISLIKIGLVTVGLYQLYKFYHFS